jgi:hypothetical protein
VELTLKTGQRLLLHPLQPEAFVQALNKRLE